MTNTRKFILFLFFLLWFAIVPPWMFSKLTPIDLDAKTKQYELEKYNQLIEIINRVETTFVTRYGAFTMPLVFLANEPGQAYAVHFGDKTMLPMIVISKDIAYSDNLSEQSLAFIFAHELTHIFYKDSLIPQPVNKPTYYEDRADRVGLEVAHIAGYDCRLQVEALVWLVTSTPFPYNYIGFPNDVHSSPITRVKNAAEQCEELIKGGK